MKKIDKFKTKVLFLFEKDSDNEIFAYFPNEIGDSKGNKTCYHYIGQHSACSIEYANECKICIEKSLFIPLFHELESIGYNLEILNLKIDKSLLTFRHHTKHNPYYDILECKIDNDSFITYTTEIARPKMEILEYYSGSNYVVNSLKRSHSNSYLFNKIPKKYIEQWNLLKRIYETYYKN